MNRRIWSILVVSSLVLGSVGPLAAEEAVDRPVSLRADAERAVERMADDDLRPGLDDGERRDLEERSRALRTNPVVGQSGGGMGSTLVLMLVGTALSVGTAYYFIKKSKEETNDSPSFGR